MKSEPILIEKKPNIDSVEISKVSLGFYNWYLDCLHNDSTYNLARPNYYWKDTTPIVEVDKYIEKLYELKFVSELFIESEKTRFQICQDSLNKISYQEVEECGCSASEFYKVCDFMNYNFWIASNETYDGCEIKELNLNKNNAIYKLIFYFNLENSTEKQFDTKFICTIHLKKYETEWLIDSIDKFLDY